MLPYAQDALVGSTPCPWIFGVVHRFVSDCRCGPGAVGRRPDALPPGQRWPATRCAFLRLQGRAPFLAFAKLTQGHLRAGLGHLRGQAVCRRAMPAVHHLRDAVLCRRVRAPGNSRRAAHASRGRDVRGGKALPAVPGGSGQESHTAASRHAHPMPCPFAPARRPASGSSSTPSGMARKDGLAMWTHRRRTCRRSTSGRSSG